MFVKTLPIVALALTAAAPLHAQSNDAAFVSNGGADGGDQERYVTSDMIEDADIVSLQGQYDENIWSSDAPLDAMVADLTEIGEIEDIVLSQDGQVQGFTTDVGGFLGIGEKTVMIPLDEIRLARAADAENLTVITRLDEDALRDLPEFALDQ